MTVVHTVETDVAVLVTVDVAHVVDVEVEVTVVV
jgi:hypothetical protein